MTTRIAPPTPGKPGEPATLATPKVLLDHVRPTVVRRRVYENPLAVGGAGKALDEHEDDEDSGPPSSVNVARALASLRGHELRRLDEILTRDDELSAALQPAPAPPPVSVRSAVPTVRIPTTIALSELARRMNIAQEEVVTALVTCGFFSITVKSSLPRETASTAAAMFGFAVEETDELVVAKPEKANRAKQKPKVSKSKLAPAKSKVAGKSKARPKPNARATGARRTSRG